MKNIISKEEFNNEIKTGIVLVDFYATWCGPCKMLSLVIEKVDEEHLIDIIKIDVDEIRELASEYKIYSVPTLIIFENGKEIKRISGFMSEDELKGWIKDEK